MRNLKTAVVLVIILFLAGCVVPSLHPLFTEKDLVFDPALVGTWAEEDQEETWAFLKSGDNVYDLIHTAEGLPVKYEAHLGRLGEFMFLDVYPGEPEVKNDFYKLHLIPVHTFWRVWIEGDVLRIAMLDPDWLKGMIAQKKVKIAHERMEDGIILTASTQELQKFILQYAEDLKAFPDPTKFHRRK